MEIFFKWILIESVELCEIYEMFVRKTCEIKRKMIY